MPTVQDVITTILNAAVDSPLTETVDTLKSGQLSQEVTGVVTTFLATKAVIRRAAELGANMIITHEPTFYNHLDQVTDLAGDPVYEAKVQLIEQTGMAIWRFHDQWHMRRPDGILEGELQALGWEAYADAEDNFFCTIPAQPMAEVVAHLKERMGAAQVRVMGDPQLLVRRVGLIIGAAGFQWHRQALRNENLDLLVVGEINEWETCEYIRDAIDSGEQRALAIVGHANSEEAGMQYLASWLRPLLGNVPVTHVPAGDPFQWM